MPNNNISITQVIVTFFTSKDTDTSHCNVNMFLVLVPTVFPQKCQSDVVAMISQQRAVVYRQKLGEHRLRSDLFMSKPVRKPT